MNVHTRKAAQTVVVYTSADLKVVNGANLGDSLSFADELDLDDTYELSATATPRKMKLRPTSDGHFVVDPSSGLGSHGADVYLDSALTLMSFNGQTLEILILVEVDTQGQAAEVYALPLARVRPRTSYTLVGIDRDRPRQRYAEVAYVSFTKGTQITMADGAQRHVEDLKVGDRLLTRDDGVQELRWVGHKIARATGDFAPVLIRANTLHNEKDLLVSPDQRLFIYQRSDQLGAGRSEVLVRARHLVNGVSVTREVGGFVEYYQLLFDEHQIIFAEGIAAETLLVDSRTSAALPREFAPVAVDHDKHGHSALEVDHGLIKDLDVATLLRNASIR